MNVPVCDLVRVEDGDHLVGLHNLPELLRVQQLELVGLHLHRPLVLLLPVEGAVLPEVLRGGVLSSLEKLPIGQGGCLLLL